MSTVGANEISREQIRTALREIIARVLEVTPDEIDVEATFFQLGASSLALVDAFRAMGERFGVRPSLRKVFDRYPTVELLSGYVLELIQTQPPLPAPTPRAADDAELLARIPLTEAQRQLLFLSRYSEAASLAHQETAVLGLRGALDVEALRGALRGVVDRHEALRTSLSLDDNAQQVHPAGGLQVEVVDLAADPEAAGAWLAAEAERPLPLDRPLFRVALLRLAGTEHLLVATAHALVADRRALQLVLDEAGRLYTAQVDGTDAELEAPVQLGAYVDRVLDHERDPAAAEAETYWLAQFADGAPALDLPADRSRPATKSYRGGRLVLPLDAATVAALRGWGERSGATMHVTLMAAFNVLLARLSGQHDLVVGAFGRGEHLVGAAEPLVANATNPLALRTRLDAEEPFGDYLRAVRDAVLGAFDHQGYPFAALVQRLNPARDESRSALFTVAFDAEPAPGPLGFGELGVEVATPPLRYTRYDLQLTVMEAGGAVQLVCDYATDLFDAPTVRRWMACFRVLLGAIAEDSQLPVSRLPILPEAERALLLDTWNRTGRDYPADLCLHQLFQAQAERTPDATALVSGTERLAYAELNRRANGLAHHLRGLGVGPDVRVGVCMERSPELVVALLAVLKAGGAYVPLDPAYPESRVRFMLEDARVPVLLTQERLAASLPAAARVVCVDAEAAAAAPRDDSPESGVGPRDLAYVIYTSGSTGTPKGVAIEHAAPVALMHWARDEFAAEEIAGVLFSTSVCFDLSVFELFVPLSWGGMVVLAENALHLPGLPAAGEVTLVNTVPSSIAELVRGEGLPESVRTVNLAGEPLKRELVERIYAHRSTVRSVVNLYGPSEDTTYSTWTRIARDGTDEVTIGRPVANTRTYVLDARLQPVPVGVPGELYLGGAGLARGYLDRPELTAERFVRDPFSADPASRLYRTGDLVRYRADGEIEFLGRVDHQVKLRGFRIELGEVESVLTRHEAVREAAVVVREDAPGDRRMVAYVVPGRAPAPAVGELRAFLRERLPEYMTPAAFVVLDTLPLTPNGKLDRAALPAPDAENRARTEHAYVAPRTPTEELLARVWREVLGVETVGVHDDFFELGGHSLLMTTLMMKVRKYFQVRLSMRDFFAAPTVEKLAPVVARLRETQAQEAHDEMLRTLGEGSSLPSPEDVRRRFEMMERDAVLDPSIVPAGTPYVPGPVRRVFLTGATGFVGVHLLKELMDQTDVEVICLVRCSGVEDGRARLAERLRFYQIFDERYLARIVPVSGDLSRERLGMSDEDYDRVAREADLLLHVGALVNFIYPYEALRQVNVFGTREVVKLAFHERVKPLHFVSTTAVWPMGAHRRFREDMSIDHGIAHNLGYDESKWTAEKLLLNARERGLPLAVYRPGEVAGSSRTGQCVTEHFAFAFIKGCIQLGAFPPMACMLDMTPVDYVARAIAHMVMKPESVGGTFQVNNPEPLHVTEVYAIFRNLGYEFEEPSFYEWRHQLMSDEGFPENALYPFAAMLEDFEAVNLQLPEYDCSRTLASLEGSGIRCHPLDAELLGLYMNYLVDIGFLPAPADLVGA